jgi:hypothetical protein
MVLFDSPMTVKDAIQVLSVRYQSFINHNLLLFVCQLIELPKLLKGSKGKEGRSG